ncbi:hypothetical protein SynA1524_01817 [Synechococcus sp. A15-24]|nr:hypothetical protein SynA1524_01817 [Synechococcus sp. A15-24]
MDIKVETLQAEWHLQLVLKDDKTATPDQNAAAVKSWLRLDLQELMLR